MFTARNKAGEEITLPKETFCEEYLEKYVAEKDRPFTEVILDENMVKVKMHPIWFKVVKYLLKHGDDWWFYLCVNESDGAFDFLEQFPENIDWSGLSLNPHPRAIKLLKENPDKIDYGYLSRNPASEVVEMLREALDQVNTRGLSMNANPLAVELLVYFDRREWDWVELSRNPGAVRLLKRNMHLVDDYALAQNPGAEDLIIEKLERSFSSFRHYVSDDFMKNVCANRGALRAIKMIQEYRSSDLHWNYLSFNPSAIEMIEQNLDRVDMNQLGTNPAALHLIKPELTQFLYWNTNASSMIYKITPKELEENSEKELKALFSNPCIGTK